MKYFVIALTCLWSNILFASQESGLIKNILVHMAKPDVVMLHIDGVDADKPSCVQGVTWEYAINISNDTGKALYSLALASYASQKKVFVFGSGVCTSVTAENVNYLHTQ